MPDQAAGDLIDVRKIVRRPAGEQLGKGDIPEFRMDTGSIEIALGECQPLQFRDIVATQPLKLIE